MQTREIQLLDIFHVLKEGWRIILLSLVVFESFGVVNKTLSNPTYFVEIIYDISPSNARKLAEDFPLECSRAEDFRTIDKLFVYFRNKETLVKSGVEDVPTGAGYTRFLRTFKLKPLSVKNETLVQVNFHAKSKIFVNSFSLNMEKKIIEIEKELFSPLVDCLDVFSERAKIKQKHLLSKLNKFKKEMGKVFKDKNSPLHFYLLDYQESIQKDLDDNTIKLLKVNKLKKRFEFPVASLMGNPLLKPIAGDTSWAAVIINFFLIGLFVGLILSYLKYVVLNNKQVTDL